MQDICDDAANGAGFGIAEVALAGEHEVSREDILALAGVTGRSSLLFLDAAQTRARLMTNPWIAEATVLKLYPGRLRIDIKERQAFALWQKDRPRLPDRRRRHRAGNRHVPPRFASLPLVVGQGAERAAQDFLALLARYPDIAKPVDAAVLVAERRWNLHLKDGVEVLLPEREPEHGAANPGRSRPQTRNCCRATSSRSICGLPDRVIVRQSDAAAAARDEALKAAEKAKKTKRKGSDA